MDDCSRDSASSRPIRRIRLQTFCGSPTGASPVPAPPGLHRTASAASGLASTRDARARTIIDYIWRHNRALFEPEPAPHVSALSVSEELGRRRAVRRSGEVRKVIVGHAFMTGGVLSYCPRPWLLLLHMTSVFRGFRSHSARFVAGAARRGSRNRSKSAQRSMFNCRLWQTSNSLQSVVSGPHEARF